MRVQLEGSNYLTLAEVVVLGTVSSPSNPPVSVPDVSSTTSTANSSSTDPQISFASAVQSSTLRNANLALDGNTDGIWGNGSLSSTHSDSEAWWTGDIGSVANISEIQIWNRTDAGSSRLSDFYVFVSEQPFASTDLATTLADPGTWSFFHSGAAGESVFCLLYTSPSPRDS